MKTIQLFIVAALMMLGHYAIAQSTGMIKGTITDEKGKPIPYAPIGLFEDVNFIKGMATDDNGDFTFHDLTPGNYDLKISNMSYATLVVKDVVVSTTQVAYVNRSLHPSNDTLIVVEVVEKYRQPIINPTFSTVTFISTEQIDNMAATKGDIVGIIVNVTPAVLETADGKDLYIRGSRRGSTQYIVDGEKVIGSADVPGMGISGLEVLTGGVPAQYGDCTGGIVIITTKDYKMEMRRKEMARKDREENEDE